MPSEKPKKKRKGSTIITDRSLVHDWPEKWISLVFTGRPWTKKNGQMIRRMKGAQCLTCGQRTGRPFISPSTDYEKKYAVPTLAQARSWIRVNNHKIIDDFVRVVYRFWMPDYKIVDASNLCEGPQDILTAAGFWTDDSLVRQPEPKIYYDKEHPRTEIWVSKYEPKETDLDYPMIQELLKRKEAKARKAIRDAQPQVDISAPLRSAMQE